MKIVGNKDNVNVITLVHKSNNIKFRCYAKPFPYVDKIDSEEDKEVEIIFNDLKEVDSLISMLERFKKESCEYMGDWKWYD